MKEQPELLRLQVVLVEGIPRSNESLGGKKRMNWKLTKEAEGTRQVT